MEDDKKTGRIRRTREEKVIQTALGAIVRAQEAAAKDQLLLECKAKKIK